MLFSSSTISVYVYAYAHRQHSFPYARLASLKLFFFLFEGVVHRRLVGTTHFACLVAGGSMLFCFRIFPNVFIVVVVVVAIVNAADNTGCVVNVLFLLLLVMFFVLSFMLQHQ